MIPIRFAAVAALSALALVPQADDTCSASKAQLVANVAAEKDIVETAVAAGNFKTLAAALQAAGLVDALRGEGPFTVFAPTDEAFAKLGKETLDTLLKPENKAKLAAILTYHVVPGDFAAAKVVKAKTFGTLNGQRVDVVASKKGVTIDGAGVIATDVVASNGRIHVLDTVILPSSETIVSTAKAAGSFQTLLTAVTTAGLAETLMGEGPFTVFAPTDAAFAKLGDDAIASLLKEENRATLKAILTYHVIPGRVYADQAIAAKSAKTLEGTKVTIRHADGKVTIDGATVVSADLDLANGVIHVIDTVLVPASVQLGAPKH